MLRGIRRLERSGCISKCGTGWSRSKLRTTALEFCLRPSAGVRPSRCSACVTAQRHLAAASRLPEFPGEERRSLCASLLVLQPMKILIVDDHAIFRDGLKRILADEFAAATFGDASNATEAIELAWKQKW